MPTLDPPTVGSGVLAPPVLAARVSRVPLRLIPR